MPSADFCLAVRRPLDRLSRLAATRDRSPGVSSIAFGAQPPDLRFAPLMDMDFAIRCPLVQRWRLLSGFCSSARTFAPRFLQTPPRGDSPCASLTLHLHQVGQRTFTSELLSMPGTQRPRPAPGQALSRSLVALDQNSTIIAVIEMSQSSWLVAGVLPGIERQPRKKLEPNAERLLGLLHRWRDEAIRAGKEITRIALAFEAGDGFWLAR